MSWCDWKWWVIAWAPYRVFIDPSLIQDESGTWWHVIGKLWVLRVRR